MRRVDPRVAVLMHTVTASRSKKMYSFRLAKTGIRETPVRKTILAALFILAGCYAVDAAPTVKASAAPASWLEPPTNLGSWSDWEEIPESHYFEVTASKLGAAQHRLTDAQFVPQEINAVKYFGGRSFRCENPAKAYLVRAIYMNGGTGRFTLYSAKSSLIVTHQSLGHARPLHQTALVACLTQAPTAVYGQVSSDL